jgi:opacity protein-like surface antigen
MFVNKKLACSIVLPAMLFSASALAVSDDPRNVDKSGPFFGETATGKWLLGLKYGSMQHDADGFSAGNNAGFMVGYEFSKPVFYGHAAIEFEYLEPTTDGTFNGFGNSNDPSVQPKFPYDGEWQNWVRSLYASYRGPGTLYVKGKAGLTASRFDATFTNAPVGVPDIRDDKTTIGWGIGLGVHAGKWIDVELEYAGNQGSSDMNFISLGANARF